MQVLVTFIQLVDLFYDFIDVSLCNNRVAL
jgi:hypothetical protein